MPLSRSLSCRKSSNTFTKTASFFRPILGMVVVMSGCFVFALVNIIIQLTKSVDSFHFAFIRAIIFTLIAAPLVVSLKKDPFPKGMKSKVALRYHITHVAIYVLHNKLTFQGTE